MHRTLQARARGGLPSHERRCLSVCRRGRRDVPARRVVSARSARVRLSTGCARACRTSTSHGHICRSLRSRRRGRPHRGRARRYEDVVAAAARAGEDPWQVPALEASLDALATRRMPSLGEASRYAALARRVSGHRSSSQRSSGGNRRSQGAVRAGPRGASARRSLAEAQGDAAAAEAQRARTLVAAHAEAVASSDRSHGHRSRGSTSTAPSTGPRRASKPATRRAGPAAHHRPSDRSSAATGAPWVSLAAETAHYRRCAATSWSTSTSPAETRNRHRLAQRTAQPSSTRPGRSSPSGDRVRAGRGRSGPVRRGSRTTAGILRMVARASASPGTDDSVEIDVLGRERRAPPGSRRPSRPRPPTRDRRRSLPADDADPEERGPGSASRRRPAPWRREVRTRRRTCSGRHRARPDLPARSCPGLRAGPWRLRTTSRRPLEPRSGGRALPTNCTLAVWPESWGGDGRARGRSRACGAVGTRRASRPCATLDAQSGAQQRPPPRRPWHEASGVGEAYDRRLRRARAPSSSTAPGRPSPRRPCAPPWCARASSARCRASSPIVGPELAARRRCDLGRADRSRHPRAASTPSVALGDHEGAAHWSSSDLARGILGAPDPAIWRVELRERAASRRHRGCARRLRADAPLPRRR